MHIYVVFVRVRRTAVMEPVMPDNKAYKHGFMCWGPYFIHQLNRKQATDS